MATVLFCSKNDIVRKSPILDSTIDSDKLVPALHLAQTQYLREIIGTDLYNKLAADIAGSSLSNPYLDLLNNFVKPILIHLTLSEFLKTAAYTISNKGVFKHTSENASETSAEEIKDLVQIERQRAESYTERFLDHMAFNASTNFPEWFSNSNEDMSPNYESYKIDWVL
jgi:flagellar motor switch protein FliG